MLVDNANWFADMFLFIATLYHIDVTKLSTNK